jgi:hypothetical protein
MGAYRKHQSFGGMEDCLLYRSIKFPSGVCMEWSLNRLGFTETFYTVAAKRSYAPCMST